MLRIKRTKQKSNVKVLEKQKLQGDLYTQSEKKTEISSTRDEEIGLENLKLTGYREGQEKQKETACDILNGFIWIDQGQRGMVNVT